MPLIKTKSEKTAATIVSTIETLAGHYLSCSAKLGELLAIVTALSDDDLADFVNHLGPAELESLCTAHKLHGESINALLASAAGVLQTGFTESVDTRPLTEKFAEQGRAIAFDNGTFTVQKIETP